MSTGKRVLIGLAIAVGGALIIGMASGILLASPAHAFYNGTSPREVFLAHVHALGITASSDSVALDSGHRVCAAISGGTPVSLLQAEAEKEMAPNGYTVSDADQFVTYAHDDLCPIAGR
jgi:hypothetical protein